jgi:disease resistance protein RPS2
VLTEETMVPSILMPDAPETGLGTEPAGQAFEMDMNNIPSSLMKDVELSSGIENMIHICHRLKVLLPAWLLSRLRLEVIGVEECDGMEEIVGTDEEGRTHQRIVSCFDTTLRVLVLKKLPNLNSIYSGSLLCNSLEEITVGDCPQLTRIPFTISHSLKKIEADPESLLNTVEHF